MKGMFDFEIKKLSGKVPKMDDLLKRGLDELIGHEKNFQELFKIHPCDTEFLQRMIDLEHLSENISTMARQVHLSVGNEREKVANQYGMKYGYKNKALSYDPSGTFRFTRSRDPNWVNGKIDEKLEAAFDELSEEERAKWTVLAEYPPPEVTKKIIEDKNFIAFLPGHVHNSVHSPISHSFSKRAQREWRDCYFRTYNNHFGEYFEKKFGQKQFLFSKRTIELKKQKHWEWTSNLASRWK